MPVLDYDLQEHQDYEGSEQDLNNIAPLDIQEWSADDINKLRIAFANHTLYLLGLGERGDLGTVAKNTFVAAINSIIDDASSTANQTWSAQKIANAISTHTLTTTQLQGVQAALDALQASITANGQAIQTLGSELDSAEADIATVGGNANAALTNAAEANAKADGRQYGSVSTANLTINAVLIGDQVRFHQLFDTTSAALTATIAADIPEGRELMINRAKGDNDLSVSTSADIVMPDGALADPLIINELGSVLMKKRSAGWEVLELGRH